jgi:hypothetical protein
MTKRGSLIVKKCLICGKEFYILNCRAKVGLGKYCSRDCQNIGVGEKVKKHWEDLKREAGRL